MKKNILVTGPPGCGKSTLIEKILTGLQVPLAGFLTREIRKMGKRIGFSIETLDGRREILANIAMESPVRVGKYGVSILALETIAVPSLHAISADSLIVIDEIGKMECLSTLFKSAVLHALDSPKTVLASIAEKGNDFIASIKAREDIVLHRILMANRDRLATSIAGELKELLAERDSDWDH